MSIRRRILEPLGLTIAIGVLACIWISIAALQTHERARHFDEQALATLERVRETRAALSELAGYVFDLLDFNTFVPPDVVSSRFWEGAQVLMARIRVLRRLELDDDMQAAVDQLEQEAKRFIGESSKSVGVAFAAAVPAPHHLAQLGADVEGAMSAVDQAARAKAARLAEGAQDRFLWQMDTAFGLMALLFMAGGAIALHRAGRLIRALRHLAQAMERIRQGQFEATVRHQQNADEIGAMARGVSAFAESLRELTQTKERIEHMALHDPLTGLGNRRALQEYLEQLLARPDCRAAVLHVDLDLFKQVNDTLGHAAGDAVLQAAADAMRENVRQSDFIARVGGDEFVIVLSRIGDEKMVADVAERVISAICRPVKVGGAIAHAGASIGIAFASRELRDADRILMNADVALYESKAAGRGKCSFYTDEMRAESARRAALASSLRAGIAKREIEPFFQPQIAGASGHLVGLEALIRWRHPEHGVLTPAKFLDVAFENGLGGALSRSMLDHSLDALGRWRGEGLEVPRISLNLASRQLRERDFVSRLQQAVAQKNLAPQDVAIEVVESVLLRDEDDPAASSVLALQEAGFPIELDDFGTGHASLSNLKKFKVDRIKIDRDLVASIDRDADHAAIVKALIDLTRNLGIACLAEGVETEAERSKLLALGCPLFQGYGIGRPMSADEATRWLRERAAASLRQTVQAVG